MGIALDTLNELKVVEFDWKHSDEHEVGMIAEEVEKVFPEAVWKENNVVMGLKPLPLIALLVKAIQELQETK
jgi:hypothetical protein